MSQSIRSLTPSPKVEHIDHVAVDVSDAGPESLSGAELDALMDNQFRHMVDVLSDGIFYMSDSEHVCFYNPKFYQRFGIESSGHTCLKKWLALVHPLDQKELEQKVGEHIQEDELRVTVQYRVRCTNGQYTWLEGTAVTKTVNGKRFMIGCHKDISDQKLMETYVHQTSFKDGSSGLSNEQKLAMDIDNLKGVTTQPHHLMYIQLGNTRSYQTLYGSQIMRNLLSHLTRSLGEFPDQFVDLYRIQSHDFAILVRGQYQESELNQLAQRVCDAYRESVKTIDFLYATDICIGFYPNICSDIHADDLVRIAAQTSQFANAQGETAKVYVGETKRQVDRHFYVEKELGHAIRNDRLSVKFQPIVCCKSQQVASFETLVRWRSEELGELYPDEFIAVAERKGLINELGYFVCEKACQFIHKYRQTHKDCVRVNINVSVLQLLTEHFPANLKQLLDRYQVAPSSVVLELTETIILDDNKQAIDQLHRLKKLGFHLSLDDFGAGYSSLNSFFDLPLSQIKIDKSVAWRSLENPVTFEYLSFVTTLCNDYGISIVIEGIEDAEMQRTFTNMGASYLQGYWFAKPLSVASASQYIKI
ncbi:EAL domain-containing protein [Vibrio sp. JPW-9-11-11]|uniref:sensor domain-containing phosphodiesterase n=1 Tax=Vibrio sp. JPW-9-11-11 TaxID=1416532 RepID=UPI001593B5E6|nr:EAL domain-containing protein [Vibrio sp. JPW-9-11-11]NVD08011.1 EAL domain-containing protein [Vibrio sp. JPW-9-11-11]